MNTLIKGNSVESPPSHQQPWLVQTTSDKEILVLFLVFLKGRFNSLRPSDTYICVSKLTIIGSDNGLLTERHQAIIWTNAGILLIGNLGTNFSEI